MDSKLPAFHNKEESLKEYWTGKEKIKGTPEVNVNRIHYSFDTYEREQQFLKAQFPTKSEQIIYRQYRAEWHRRAHEFDAGDAPLAVNCELVSTCNLACTMCYTITKEFRNSVTGAQRMMPWPQVKAIIDECAKMDVPSISFSWRGESTLYQYSEGNTLITFPDVLKYARDKNILEITSLTHGQLIDTEMATAIVNAEPNWISFSMDGIHDQYNKIRTPKNLQGTNFDSFSKVVENIRTLIRIRNQQGKTRPQIRSNAIYPAIHNNKREYREFLQSIGIDLITVNELLDLRNGEITNDMIMENWSCQYPFQRLTVSANGIILPCTGAHKEQSGLILGRYVGSSQKLVHDVKGQPVKIDLPQLSLKDAWNCDKIEQIRKLHQAGRRTEINPGCKHCNHGVKKFGAQRLPADWDKNNLSWTSLNRKG